MRSQHNYERDDETFPAGAYQVARYAGVAFRVLGWETEPDEDTEWSGIESRTGRVVVVMIGDDRKIIVDLDDVTPIPREAYCGECGQIGCTCDGYDRTEDTE